MRETLHIYTRVSTSRQEKKGYSINDQKVLGEKLSKDNKWNVKLWNEGGKSSNHDWNELEKKRPVLFELSELIDRGDVKYLFVINEDRLFRTSDVRTRLTLKLLKNDVQIFTEKGKYSFDNSTDRVMFQIWSIFSEEENIKRRKLSVQGKISGMKKGHWKGGDVNFGYKLVDKKLQINKEESVHIKKLFQMYDKGKSTKDLQNYLLSEGQVTRRNNKVFSLQSILNILKNTTYIGYHDMSVTDFHYRFECPPIVDEVLFQRVQMKIKDNLKRKSQKNTTTHKYLLRDYMYCGCCENGMSGLWREKLKQFNYFCPNRSRLWKRYKNGKEYCSMRRTLNIIQTDFMVWETVCDTLEKSSTLKEEFKNQQLESKNKSDKDLKNEIRRKRTKINRISREINDLNENLLLIEKQKWTNKMDVDTYKEVKSSIVESIQELESERDEVEITITDSLSKKKWLNWIDRYSRKIEKHRNTKSMDIKKDILGEVLNKIIVNWDDEVKEHLLDIQLKLPLFNDKIVYNDEKNKSLGYKLKGGQKNKTIRFKKTNNVNRFIESKKKRPNSKYMTYDSQSP